MPLALKKPPVLFFCRDAAEMDVICYHVAS